MKLPILFNPASGTRRKSPDTLLRLLPAELRDRVEPIPFGPPWDFEPAIAQARQAGGPLFVWGGDGTVHHAARALVDRGCPVPLAAIPGGSGNGLVRGLQTPLAPALALQRLLEGRELRLDLPRLDGAPFVNLCGTGFEAAVAHRFDAMPGRGFQTYARACVSLWRTWPESAVAWDTDLGSGASREGLPTLPTSVWSLTLANLPTHGGGLHLATGADPTDGALQWATLARPGWTDLLTQVPALFRTEGRTPLRQEGRLLRAALRFERPLPWHLDGEPVAERDRAELTLAPRAFRMQVTRACPWS